MKNQVAKTVLYALSAFREAEIKEIAGSLDDDAQMLGFVLIRSNKRLGWIDMVKGEVSDGECCSCKGLLWEF